jgi:hypothetical protein
MLKKCAATAAHFLCLMVLRCSFYYSRFIIVALSVGEGGAHEERGRDGCGSWLPLEGKLPRSGHALYLVILSLPKNLGNKARVTFQILFIACHSVRPRSGHVSHIVMLSAVETSFLPLGKIAF